MHSINGGIKMNKVIIVTGGTKGIGLATVKKFLEEGDKVVTCGRRPTKEIEELEDVTFVKGDVSQLSDCKNIVAVALEKYGKIDVLVNVAGVVGERNNILDVDLADVEKTIQINLMGTIYMSKLVAENMVKNRSGVIVNVGSICGFMANTEAIGYHASKGGVKMITQSLARELSPFGIRVVSVAPGWVKTGMIDKPIEEIGSKLHMKGRIILPEEIAGAIWLMTLKEASAINGTTVMCDDGYSSFKGVDGYIAQ